MPTENGWEPSPRIDPNDPLLVWRTVPGSDVRLQVRNDDAGTAMLAYAADYHAYVEPLVDRMTACYTPTNSVSTSNHLNATAMDFDWEYYPWKQRGNLNGDKLARLRDLLAYWQGIMFWAGDWSDAYVDEMHHQMDYGSYDLERNGQLGQWIKDHIRADGFSTYQRGNADVPPPAPVLSKADGYSVLIIQEGQRRGITPRGIEIALATALVESNIQVYANEAVPASMSIPHDAVGSDAFSVGIFQQQVRDTGNGWWWGDAATCMDPTLSAGLFYGRLVTHDYNNTANSPGSYAQAVQSSAFPDRYDQRFQDAVDIYNRLANISTDPGDDDLSDPAVVQMITDIHDELTKKFPSRSPLRHLDQTQYYPNGLVDTGFGMTLNDDGMIHAEFVEWMARKGHKPSLDLLREVSAADPGQYPDRADDIKLAQVILNGLASPAATTTSAPVPVAAPVQPQVVYVPAPTPTVELSSSPSTTGQAIGQLYDALEAINLQSLPSDVKAPLESLITVLQTKTQGAAS